MMWMLVLYSRMHEVTTLQYIYGFSGQNGNVDQNGYVNHNNVLGKIQKTKLFVDFIDLLLR